MENQRIIVMELKKDTDAPEHEVMAKVKIQAHNGSAAVLAEQQRDNNGQARDIEQQQLNQVSDNQHHQTTAARHPPQQPPPPPQAHLQSKLMTVMTSHHQQHQQAHVSPQPPTSQPEHTPTSRHQSQQQQQHWSVNKDHEGGVEQRLGNASAAQPITVITAPKIQRLNNSPGTISEQHATTDENEVPERTYQEIVSTHRRQVESGGVADGAEGHTVTEVTEEAYCEEETIIETTVTTSRTTTAILVTDPALIESHLNSHPASEQHQIAIYHDQVQVADGTDGNEVNYRNVYYQQFHEPRSEAETTLINRNGHPVSMAASYVNHYRYASPPGRIVSTGPELKPIQMESQQGGSQSGIYSGAELVQTSIANGQGQLAANDNNNIESKLHYTNLDTSYISHEHYAAPPYIPPPPGNSVLGKDYIFGPSNNVLYKDMPILASHHRQQYLYTPISMGQPMYDSQSPGGCAPPPGQPRFSANQSYTNNFDGYNFVIDETMPPEYQNGWPTTAATGYEDASGEITLIPPTSVVNPITKCVHCNSTTAPHYRPDQNGHLICNNCSARPAQQTANRPNRSKAKAAPAVNNNRRTGIVCANCHTSTTTLWRRNNSGDPVCNACGLYYKLHNTPRPIAMKKEGVQTRKRKPKNVPNNISASKIPSREKVLPSMIPPPDPKLIQPGPHELGSGAQGSGGSAQEHAPEPQHFIPVHSQAGGQPMPTNMYIVRPLRNVSPATTVDTTRCGIAETTSVITSTGAPSGP